VTGARENCAICALQNRDTTFNAKPHNETADGAGKTLFKRISPFFSYRLQAVEIAGYNH
jgi:hypothetical protein